MNIKPSKDRQAIRLQFTVEGVPFSFAPLRGGKWESKRDRQLVAAIATKIENDILSGHFDLSLERYRHKSSAEISLARSAGRKKSRWVDIWDKWVDSLDLPIPTMADHYACVRVMLVKAGNPFPDNIEWLQISELAASTFNRRLSMLRSCLLWAVEEGLIKPVDNPLKKVRSRTVTEDERQRSDKKKAPLSDAEIERILNHLDRAYSTYAPFVRFLLFSGVRTGEAVGLTWENIDLEKRLIFIKQSVSRQRGKYQKICKSPKTKESVRTLKMSDRVFALFSSLTLPGVNARGFFDLRHDLLMQDFSNKSRGLISQSVACIKYKASRMPYGSQSSTQDISSCIKISIHHTTTLTNVSSCG